MNQLVIIGNLTRAPELRQTQDGTPVCNFTVAVNRRVRAGANPEADYFRVTAWRGLGENCYRYLEKGRKVAVAGAISARASLEVTAEAVEFLSSPRHTSDGEGFTEVDDAELPEGFR